jgi:hypothetical protein
MGSPSKGAQEEVVFPPAPAGPDCRTGCAFLSILGKLRHAILLHSAVCIGGNHAVCAIPMQVCWILEQSSRLEAVIATTGTDSAKGFTFTAVRR